MEGEQLLQKLGFTNITLSGTTSLEECIYPRDKSLNIGFYNGCLVLSDDYQLTGALDQTSSPQDLAGYEHILSALYPQSEILSVACHSVNNYHVYSLVKGGRKIRYKRIADGEPLREYGDRLEQEDSVYAFSQIFDGQRLFRSTYRDDGIYDMTEDQMMEDFTFGVAKRLLGVMISSDEDEELMGEVPFNKYKSTQTAVRHQTPTAAPTREVKARRSWLLYLFGRN